MTSSAERTPPMSANGCQRRVSCEAVSMAGSIARGPQADHRAISKPTPSGCVFPRLASVRFAGEGFRQMSDTDLDIRLRGLRKTYGEVAALDGVDLDIVRGEFFTLLGPSGSGKTTTLRLIAG